MSTNEALLQVRDLRKEFPVKSWLRDGTGDAFRQGCRRRQLRHRRGDDARPRRRVGLGQVDDGLLRPPVDQADGGVDPVQGQRADGARSRGDAEDAPRDADRLPGSVLVARSADDGRRHRLRAAGGARCRREEGPALACARAPGRRRLQPRLLEPLPPRVLGRPAPARRRGAGARPEPVADRLRRAGLGARRVDPGADSQPPEGSPAGFRLDLSLHLPRSRRRPVDERPHRGDEGRTDRRDRGGRRGLRAPEARVHARAPHRGAGSPIRSGCRSAASSGAS